MSGLRERRSVVFEYQPSRSGAHADEFLADFAGYHQCDAFSGYLNLHKKEEVTGVGCAAHGRRKFMEIVKLVKTAGCAHQALSLYNALYAIEKKIQWQPHEVIKAERLKQSTPILEELYTLLTYHKDLTPPQGILSKAINYTLNQWDNLTRYLENGMLRIDNNDIEQIIRPFAIGRGNWMFCNTESGANASSIIYSIIATCKANKINCYNYLKYVLENIHLAVTEEDLRKLLPYNIDPDILKNFRRV
jgi:transposase